jgi:hypothetical protein
MYTFRAWLLELLLAALNFFLLILIGCHIDRGYPWP